MKFLSLTLALIASVSASAYLNTEDCRKYTHKNPLTADGFWKTWK